MGSGGHDEQDVRAGRIVGGPELSAEDRERVGLRAARREVEVDEAGEAVRRGDGPPRQTAGALIVLAEQGAGCPDRPCRGQGERRDARRRVRFGAAPGHSIAWTRSR